MQFSKWLISLLFRICSCSFRWTFQKLKVLKFTNALFFLFDKSIKYLEHATQSFSCFHLCYCSQKSELKKTIYFCLNFLSVHISSKKNKLLFWIEMNGKSHCILAKQWNLCPYLLDLRSDDCRADELFHCVICAVQCAKERNDCAQEKEITQKKIDEEPTILQHVRQCFKSPAKSKSKRKIKINNNCNYIMCSKYG